MKVSDIIERIKNGNLPVVRFTRKIEDYESYFDENMVAVAVYYTSPDEDGVSKIVFYTKPYDKWNCIVEKSEYWDDRHNPTATAREAGVHPENNHWKEPIYVDAMDENFPAVFIDDDSAYREEV